MAKLLFSGHFLLCFEIVDGRRYPTAIQTAAERFISATHRLFIARHVLPGLPDKFGILMRRYVRIIKRCQTEHLLTIVNQETANLSLCIIGMHPKRFR